MDTGRIEKAVREILEAVGEDPDREGLRDTPARVARYYAEVLDGIGRDPADEVDAFFGDEHYQEIVMVKDIPFYSLCEHHLVPFHGKAHVAYLPRGQVTGLSTGPVGRGYTSVPDAGAHRSSRRRPRRPAQPARRSGRDRGRAPVHVDARGEKARGHHCHVGGSGNDGLRPGHPGRGDVASLRDS